MTIFMKKLLLEVRDWHYLAISIIGRATRRAHPIRAKDAGGSIPVSMKGLLKRILIRGAW